MKVSVGHKVNIVGLLLKYIYVCIKPDCIFLPVKHGTLDRMNGCLVVEHSVVNSIVSCLTMGSTSTHTHILPCSCVHLASLGGKYLSITLLLFCERKVTA